MNWKKVGVYSILVFMLITPLMSLALAQTEATPGVNQDITNPAWLVDLINFMGFGKTWALFIISLAVLVMVFAAAYDILEFTAFERTWVKGMIAAGIALVVAVSRGVVYIAAFLMSIVGGSVVFATATAIGFAIVFFVIATFFKGKMKAMKYKSKAQEAEGAYELAIATTKADIKKARAAANAAAG